MSVVQLDVERDWCPRHLDPFRRHWPAGIGAATTRLFDVASAHPDVLDACGYDPATSRLADAEHLQQALADRAPLCCFVHHDDLGQIYTAALPTVPPPDAPAHITAGEYRHEEMFLLIAMATPVAALCGDVRPVLPHASRGRPVCDDCARIANATGLDPAINFPGPNR